MSSSNSTNGRSDQPAQPPVGPGRIFMWLPPETPVEPTADALTAANGRVDVLEEQHALALWLGAGDFGELAEILDKHLGAYGLAHVRAVYMEGDAAPTWRDLAHARPLGDYVAAQRALWLMELVDNNRLTSHFQPIVYAQDTSRVFAQEALLRAVDAEGKLVPPYRMFGAARDAGMLDMLDGHARTTALREAKGHKLQNRIFINLNPASVRDPEALASTLELVRTLGMEREQVVFELVESDHGVSGASLEALRAYFTAEGFKLALDDLGSGYSSLNLIHRLRPDYIKLDMDLIRDVHEDPYKARITGKILELAQELDIETIAEGVETLGELRWLRARGATYLQGYLIAKPQSPPNLAPAAIDAEDTLETTIPAATKTVA